MRGEGGDEIIIQRRNKTLSDMYQYIDYSKNLLDERLQQVNRAIETEFFQSYIDEGYNPHPTRKESLSEDDIVCKCMEKMADYILSCDEEIARKKSEHEYIYFNNKKHLDKKLRKELTFGSMLPESKLFQDIVLNNIIEDDVGRIALPKDVEVTEEDMEGDTPMSRCLQEYQGIINTLDQMIQSGEGNRKDISLQKHHILQDMITIKRCFMGIEEYKHDNLNNIPNHGYFNLGDEDVVYGFSTEIYGKPVFIQGLLFYDKPEGLDANDPLSIALYDMEQCLQNSENISDEDRRLVKLLRQGVSRKSIAKVLRIDTSTVSRRLQKITNIIKEECK